MSAEPIDVTKKDVRVNETNLAYVGVALGGPYVLDVLRWMLLYHGPIDEEIPYQVITDALQWLLDIEARPDLMEIAQVTVSWWTIQMSTGQPIDHRARGLAAAWCHRDARPPTPGRRADSGLRKMAARWEMACLAATTPNNRGSKKQMLYHLQDKFGLKRSQLSEFLSGLDPWTDINELWNKASDLERSQLSRGFDSLVYMARENKASDK